MESVARPEDSRLGQGQVEAGPSGDPAIAEVLFAQGLGGFFYDDLAAIQAGAVRDGQRYEGRPVTAGFTSIRMPAKVLRIGLRLSDGWCVWGDCMSVQYAGTARRDSVFEPGSFDDGVRVPIAAELVSAPAADLMGNLNRVREVVHRLGLEHRGFAYGLSQALLAAAAYGQRRTMTESVCDSFELPVVLRAVPVYAQSGEDRYDSVDKMIAKRVQVMPHGLVNSTAAFGPAGEDFLAYVGWVRDRIIDAGDAGYQPKLHFDVYGLPGSTFGSYAQMIDFFAKLERASDPFAVSLEAPVMAPSLDEQIESMASIRRDLRKAGIAVKIVADEWCNEIDDIRQFVAGGACDMIQIKMPDVGWLDDTVGSVELCRAGGVDAFLGGSCTETDVSARYSVHLAIATQAAQLLAKPGMGVDEALMIVGNEQAAVLQMLRGTDRPVQSA